MKQYNQHLKFDELISTKSTSKIMVRGTELSAVSTNLLKKEY